MKKILFLIFFAFALRMGMVLIWHHAGYGDHLPSDAQGYYAIGKSLVEGKGFQLDGEPTSRRPPVYPLFIALALQLNIFPLGIHIIQAFAGALSCLILFFLGRAMFSERVGMLASLVFSVDYLAIRQTVSVMPDLFFIFFLLASFWFLFRSQTQKRWLFISGLLGGISILTREVLVFYFPFVLVWILLWKGEWRVRRGRALAFTLGLFLAVAPWVVRNCLVHHRFVLITVSSGHTLYLGNNPLVTGRTTGGEWELGRDTDLPPDPDMPPLFTVEADRYFFHKALDYIQTHPQRFVDLMARKTLKMWRPYLTESPRPVQWATALSYFPVVIFGLLGIIWSRNRWRDFFPLLALFAYLILIHAVTISGVRYRLPLMPFLMIFASFAAAVIWDKLKSAFGVKTPQRCETLPSS